jgi:hypothetical protein
VRGFDEEGWVGGEVEAGFEDWTGLSVGESEMDCGKREYLL